MKKIANGFKGLVDQQKDHTVALLKHETVIVEREGVQKRFADLRHCLEEAQVPMWCALNEIPSCVVLYLKAQFNEAKRSTEFAKDKAKQCLTEAQRLSGVKDPNDITSEKQAVNMHVMLFHVSGILVLYSNMIVIQMTWEKLRKEFMSIKQGPNYLIPLMQE